MLLEECGKKQGKVVNEILLVGLAILVSLTNVGAERQYLKSREDEERKKDK